MQKDFTSGKKLLELAEEYQRCLMELMESKSMKVAPHKFGSGNLLLSEEDYLNCLLWMVQEVPGAVNRHDIARATKWVTFVTGALWALGHMKISD